MIMENLEFKGTKGEWKYEIDDCRIIFDNPNMDLWFKNPDNHFTNSRKDVIANAKLIAAAPETIKELIKSTEVLEELLKIRISGGRQFGKTMLFNQIKSNYKAIEKALS